MIETTETAQDLLNARKNASIEWRTERCSVTEREKRTKEEKAKNPYHIGYVSSYNFSAFQPPWRGHHSYQKQDIEKFQIAVKESGYKCTEEDAARLRTGKKNDIDNVLNNLIFTNQDDNFLIELPPNEQGPAASKILFFKLGNFCYNLRVEEKRALSLTISIFSKSSKTLTLVIQLSTRCPGGVDIAYLKAILPFGLYRLHTFNERMPDPEFRSIDPDSIKHLVALRECLLTNELKNIHPHAADLIASIRKRRPPVTVEVVKEKKEEKYYEEKPARDVDYFRQVIEEGEKEKKSQAPYENYPHTPFEVAAKLQAIQTFSLNMTSVELVPVLVEYFRYVLKDKKQVKAIKMKFLSPFITELWSAVVDCKKIEEPPHKGKWKGTRSVKPIIYEIVSSLADDEDTDDEETEAMPFSVAKIFEKLKPLLVAATEEAIRLTKEKVGTKPMGLAEETSGFTKVGRAISSFWNSFSQKSGEKESLEKKTATKQTDKGEDYVLLSSLPPSPPSLASGPSKKVAVKENEDVQPKREGP